MFSRLFEDILDLLFPRSPLTRELESLDAFMFAARVEKTDGYAGKNIISLFHYRDKLVRQAVWELKYRGNKKSRSFFRKRSTRTARLFGRIRAAHQFHRATPYSHSAFQKTRVGARIQSMPITLR